ncbi:hypothetical protein [Plantactinospora sp. GCM10030261]|uniref:hypothetical protein n=1 Tax=Plantactinospora sp. GCM10030261 TaxID=3273420 RepID=UPI00361ABA23
MVEGGVLLTIPVAPHLVVAVVMAVSGLLGGPRDTLYVQVAGDFDPATDEGPPPGTVHHVGEAGRVHPPSLCQRLA